MYFGPLGLRSASRTVIANGSGTVTRGRHSWRLFLSESKSDLAWISTGISCCEGYLSSVSARLKSLHISWIVLLWSSRDSIGWWGMLRFWMKWKLIFDFRLSLNIFSRRALIGLDWFLLVHSNLYLSQLLSDSFRWYQQRECFYNLSNNTSK